jgi:hypothetical protein
MRDRYGHGRRRRWPVVAAVVLVVAGIGWLAWVIWAQSSPEVTSGMESRDIGDHTSTVTLRLRLADTDVRPSCLVRATAEDHSIVGELNFTVEDAPSTSFSVTREIRTERRPTAIESLGCTAPGQDRRR